MNQNNNETKKEKTKESLTKVMKKASEVAQKTAQGIQKGAVVVSEKTKKSIQEHQLKKYNPLFPKEFKSKSFKIPNIIKIVDDAVRRDVEVCEGAIGWTAMENGTEVLFLYDEAINISGIEFIPNAACDQIYYVDHFDRNRFIQINCIFERAHSEKLAELEHIAYSLGAKSCLIEIVESDSETTIKEKEVNIKKETNASAKVKVEGTGEINMQKIQSKEFYSSRSGKTRTYFEGNNTPTRPTLKWFANDNNIKGLIDMRCSDNNSIISRTLTLSGSTSATMSQSIACTLDSLISKGISGKATKTEMLKISTSMFTKAVKESNRTLIFDIEF